MHGNPIRHVFWIQGRCMLVLGNEGEGSFVELLSTGARAIYARTKGECRRVIPLGRGSRRPRFARGGTLHVMSISV